VTSQCGGAVELSSFPVPACRDNGEGLKMGMQSMLVLISPRRHPITAGRAGAAFVV
jgi:hypothetical protein